MPYYDAIRWLDNLNIEFSTKEDEDNNGGIIYLDKYIINISNDDQNIKIVKN